MDILILVTGYDEVEAMAHVDAWTLARHGPFHGSSRDVFVLMGDLGGVQRIAFDAFLEDLPWKHPEAVQVIGRWPGALYFTGCPSGLPPGPPPSERAMRAWERGGGKFTAV